MSGNRGYYKTANRSIFLLQKQYALLTEKKKKLKILRRKI